MNIIDKALNLIRRKKTMSKIMIKHESGPMEGETYVYGRNFTIWPDGTETKVKGEHDLEEIVRQAQAYEKEGNKIKITKYYDRI